MAAKKKTETEKLLGNIADAIESDAKRAVKKSVKNSKKSKAETLFIGAAVLVIACVIGYFAKDASDDTATVSYYPMANTADKRIEETLDLQDELFVLPDDGSIKINVNTAGVNELTQLKGIGKAKAEAIIAYRTEHGPFADADALLAVDGIGMSIVDSIRDFITF